ncbi:MAG: hypothetical protein F4022_02210, partial [Gemmatimonadetes bacterium]|nr:hypothetical protein [Gemmatimonadota bacterium]
AGGGGGATSLGVLGPGSGPLGPRWGGWEGDEDLAAELKKHVAGAIGPIARPEAILFAADLPKTRSGKIMRRLLGDIAAGRALGDTTTLADPAVVQSLKERYEAKEG